MVKIVAQTLQAFGTELAETELPNDAEATVELLNEHTLKKDTMKVNNRLSSFINTWDSIIFTKTYGKQLVYIFMLD